MERHTTPCRILPPTVFCYTLIRPSVLLLKIRNLQNGVGILQFDFARERSVAGFSPADLWNWTVKQSKTTIKTLIPLETHRPHSQKSICDESSRVVA